jgi:transcription elongation factor Elf1
MQTTAEFYCAFCGEENTTFIDVSQGNQQQYIEDCQVCCRPNILYVRIDEESLDIEIDTEYEEG